jgi:hypothetical protein
MTLFKVVADMVTRISHPLAALKDTFFRAVSPLDLAVLRVFIYGFYCYEWWGKTYTLSAWEGQTKKVGLYRLVGLTSDSTLSLMQHAGSWAALLCVFGLAFRPASIVCALTLPYLIGLGNNFGKVDHGANLFALSFLVLALSRAGDYASIDAWIKQRKAPGTVLPSAEYRWPIAAVWLLMCGMYCSAGVSKLVHTG